MSEHESDMGTLAGRLHADKPDVEILREALDYDPETGELRWKTRPRHHFSRGLDMRRWNTCFSGRLAGCVGAYGYLNLTVSNRHFQGHRIAWVLYTGTWPPELIDHVNGVRHDNRIENLRLATQGENLRNSNTPMNNTSGVKGVSWHSAGRKWSAYVNLAKKRFYLGLFNSIEEAAQAVRVAREKHHGEFANHG